MCIYCVEISKICKSYIRKLEINRKTFHVRIINMEIKKIVNSLMINLFLAFLIILRVLKNNVITIENSFGEVSMP